jgi:gliding motility-associatede transport system auxiliary component
VRARNISTDGEMVISFHGREALAKTATEEALTSALEKLARPDTRWVAYLSGRGERDLLGTAGYDLGRLGARLQRQGFKLHALKLAEAGEIPAEASLLVITPGSDDLSPEEAGAVLRYLDAGGSLLWLAEPGSLKGMKPVADTLGIALEPGVLVDPTTRSLGIAQPDFLPVSAYPNHPVTRNLKMMTVYPRAAGISWTQPPGWQTRGILSTGLRAWSETGDLTGDLHFDDAADVSGPLDVAVAMQRSVPDGNGQDEAREQRVIVVGDGDFLSNAYLGNGANLDLALNMFNWLAEDDVLVDIPARTAPDLAFELSRGAELLIRFSVALGLPALLLGAGFVVWQRRRRL